MWSLENMAPLLLLRGNERYAKIKGSLNISNFPQFLQKNTHTCHFVFFSVFNISDIHRPLAWALGGEEVFYHKKPMIAFDICARSISYLLCLISEFSSIIKIKTLLTLPSMCHITSIFSKNHVQFLGTGAPWTDLEFQILLSCYTNCSSTLWDDTWTMEIHCFLTLPQLKPWDDLVFPVLLTYLWFFSHPIISLWDHIFTLEEDWSFGLCKMTSPSKPTVMDKVGLDVQAECIFPVSSSILFCLLNFSFKEQLRMLTQRY